MNDKTDRNDAHFLSDMLYQQTALGIRPIKPDQRIRQIVQARNDIKQLQQLVRRHCELTESLVRTKNRLRELLNRLFPEFTDAIGDPNTPTALRIRVEYPTPAAIAQASIGDLFACRPKTAKKPTNAVLMRLHQLAAVSVGVTGANVESICLEQRQLIHTLHLFSAQIDEMEQAITVLIGQSREGQILQSLPMISPLRAAYLLASIGCIANFPKASHLCAYVGWAPRRTQTGSSRDSMRISRAGNRMLKSMMYLLTLEAVRRDTVWRDIYKQLVERKCPYDGRLQRRTGRMKVIVRIGNQIVRLIYLLLKKDYDLRQSLPEGAELPPPTLYDPSYHQARRTVSKKNSLKL